MIITLSNNKQYTMPVNSLVLAFLSWLHTKSRYPHKHQVEYDRAYKRMAYEWTDEEIEAYISRSQEIVWC